MNKHNYIIQCVDDNSQLINLIVAISKSCVDKDSFDIIFNGKDYRFKKGENRILKISEYNMDVGPATSQEEIKAGKIAMNAFIEELEKTNPELANKYKKYYKDNVKMELEG